MTRLCFSVSECIHSQPLPSTLVPSSFITVTICKPIYAKSVHLVSKVLSGIYVAIPEVVVAKAVLDAPLEFSNVPTAVFACVNSTTVTLSIRPLSGVNVARVEPINPITMPKTLSVLAPVTAASGPRLYTIAVVLAIDPIALVPTAHVIVIDAASRALALVELPLVDVTVAVDLDPAAGVSSFLRLGSRPDGPEDRQRRPGESRCGGELDGERPSEEQANGREARESEIEREKESGGESKSGDEI